MIRAFLRFHHQTGVWTRGRCNMHATLKRFRDPGDESPAKRQCLDVCTPLRASEKCAICMLPYDREVRKSKGVTAIELQACNHPIHLACLVRKRKFPTEYNATVAGTELVRTNTMCRICREWSDMLEKKVHRPAQTILLSSDDSWESDTEGEAILDSMSIEYVTPPAVFANTRFQPRRLFTDAANDYTVGIPVSPAK